MPKFTGTIYVGNTGLKVADTNASHFVTLKPGSNVTADRTLTLTTGDGDRTMDVSSGSTTISTFGASLMDDTDASAARTTLGLGTLATQSGTFSGTSSGTNTGDQTLYNQTIEDEGTPVAQRSTINFTGSGVSVTDTGGKTTVTISGGGGGGGAPTDATYVTLSTNGTLSDERVLVVGTGLDLTDGGAGSTVAISLDLSELTTADIEIDDEVPFTDVSNANANAKSTVEGIFHKMARNAHRRGFEFFSDFVFGTGTGDSDGSMKETNSGSSAATTGDRGTIDRPGRARSTTGTTTTGRAAMASALNSIMFGGGEWFFETAVKLTSLSDGTNRFQLVVGFLNVSNTVDQTNAAAFVYDEGGISNGSTAASYWQTLTALDSTRTWNTGLTQTTVDSETWFRLGIIVNADGTSVDFLIDGTVVATHTTNIPVGANSELGFGWLLIKSVGTTARTADFDYVAVNADFTSER